MAEILPKRRKTLSNQSFFGNSNAKTSNVLNCTENKSYLHEFRFGGKDDDFLIYHAI